MRTHSMVLGPLREPTEGSVIILEPASNRNISALFSNELCRGPPIIRARVTFRENPYVFIYRYYNGFFVY